MKNDPCLQPPVSNNRITVWQPHNSTHRTGHLPAKKVPSNRKRRNARRIIDYMLTGTRVIAWFGFGVN